MKKRQNYHSLILALCIFCFSTNLTAQVTIGSSNPPAQGALLQLKDYEPAASETVTAHKGFLLPRVNLTDLEMLWPMFESDDDYNNNINGKKDTEDAAHVGLLVFYEHPDDPEQSGMYYWSGRRWRSMIASEEIDLSTYNRTRDSLALVALYNSTGGTQWTTQTNWLTSEPINRWHGVVTSKEIFIKQKRELTVTQINLEGNKLNGTIPAEIGTLVNLKEFNIPNNTVGGAIPEEFGSLSSLERMVIDRNQFTTLPTTLGHLSNLTFLQGYNNQITNLPESVGSLKKLGYLDLASNQLTAIPPELGSASSLYHLDLSRNWKYGMPDRSLPTTLGNLAELTYLDVTNCHLSGHDVLPSFLNLTKLRHLNLGGNQLTGTIPAKIDRLTELQYLSLSGNQLTGEVLPVLGNLSKLQHLSLSSNEFTGEIPSALGNLTELKVLRLSSNQLSGMIPDSFGNLVNLTNLYLGTNQLTGVIPVSFGYLINMEILNLSGNQLSGTIPTQLGNLTKLRNLDLKQNELSGIIPASLGNLTELTDFYLNNNQLSGELPASLGNLTKVIYFHIQDNLLTGDFPAIFDTMPYARNASAFNAKRNRFSGLVHGELSTNYTYTDMALCPQYDENGNRATKPFTNVDLTCN